MKSDKEEKYIVIYQSFGTGVLTGDLKMMTVRAHLIKDNCGDA